MKKRIYRIEGFNFEFRFNRNQGDRIFLIFILITAFAADLTADLNPSFYWRTTYNGQYTDSDVFGPLTPHGKYTANAGIYYSDYVGLFYGEFFPWVYVSPLGWVYFSESDPSLIYVDSRNSFLLVNGPFPYVFNGWYKLGKVKLVIPSDQSRPYWGQDWYSFNTSTTVEINLSWIFTEVEYR